MRISVKEADSTSCMSACSQAVEPHRKLVKEPTRFMSLCHDELRLPLFAQLLGFDLVDTGFYDGWSNPDSERHFNADGREVDPAAVAIELAKRDGCRVFHPCRERFDEMVVASIARSLS